jgi:uncharacterized protein (UPF0262 family)
MINFKLIGIELGEGLKRRTPVNEINRYASAIFDFNISYHSNEHITSARSGRIYDLVMTLAEQPIEEEKKIELLK